jgi:hypothetical protein
MAKRIPLNRPSTRKRAEVHDGKPPESTRFSASNQTDHAASGAEALDNTQPHRAAAMDEKINEDRRAYEVKFGAETEFVILPGENPLEFEMLHGQVAEELSPDGPLEEDLVLTIAKCLWRKQRFQRFLAARVMAAKFDPSHMAYDEAMALNAFFHAIDGATHFGEVRRSLGRLGGHFADHLDAECPRRKFQAVEDWVKAMQEEVQKVLLPAATRFKDPPDEVRIEQSSAVLTDDVFARELEFEELNNRILEQALARLERIKRSKRQTSFREAQRFGRTHQGLIIGLVK